MISEQPIDAEKIKSERKKYDMHFGISLTKSNIVQKHNTSTKKLQLEATESWKTTTLAKYSAPNSLCLNNERKSEFSILLMLLICLK